MNPLIRNIIYGRAAAILDLSSFALVSAIKAEPAKHIVHSYIKPCFSVLGIDFFHFNSSAGSFYKDEKMAKNTEFETVSSDVP